MNRQNGNDPGLRPLPRLGVQPPEVDPEVERLLRETEALIDEDRGASSAVRRLSTGTRVLAACAASALAVALVAAFAPRSDLAGIPAWQLAVATVVQAAPIAALVWCVLAPLQRVELRPEHSFAVIVVGFSLPFLWAVIPPLASAQGHGFTRHGCLLVGLALGGLFIAALRALDRVADGDPRGVALGAAAGGLVANLALAFYCPDSRWLHLAIAHAPIGLLLLLVYRRAVRTSPTTRMG